MDKGAGPADDLALGATLGVAGRLNVRGTPLREGRGAPLARTHEEGVPAKGTPNDPMRGRGRVLGTGFFHPWEWRTSGRGLAQRLYEEENLAPPAREAAGWKTAAG